MRDGNGCRSSRAGISPYLVTLLALAMFLNYTDRGSLSIVAPALQHALGISNAAMGLTLSAFFWSYAIAQPAAGWVAQRFAPRTVLAVATGLWSLATFACGLATALIMLFVFRMLLGLAESVIFPTNARIFAEHALEHQRGRCNSAMSIGHSMGPTVGTLLGAAVLIAYGWRGVIPRSRAKSQTNINRLRIERSSASARSGALALLSSAILTPSISFSPGFLFTSSTPSI